MFCKKCGEQIGEDLRFCPKCGTPVNLPTGADEKVTGRKHGKLKVISLAIVAVILIGAAGGAFYFVSKDQNEKKQYALCLDSGNKYLEDMDYEKAEVSYLEAIKIKPKEKESYMKLADVYMAQDEQEKATAILKKALDNIAEENSEDVEERYNLYSYVNRVLVSRMGRVEEGIYECNYSNWGGDGGIVLYPVSTEKGVMNWQVADYDGDGTEELLVLILENQSDASAGDTRPRNKVILQMYANEGSTVVLKDQYEGLEPVLGSGDTEDDGIFLKKNGDLTYICGSNSGLINTFADGTTVKSFILSYQEGKFVYEAGLEQATSSSIPTDYAGTVNKMCELTEQLGLSNETAQLWENGWPRFAFTDEVDKTLLRIVGHNKGFDATKFYRSSLPEYLGKVVVELKYGEMQAYESEPEPTVETPNEQVEQNNTSQDQMPDITGDWTIDEERTNANNEDGLWRAFGSSIESGYNLSFDGMGSFAWYIGYDGGNGSYTIEENSISAVCNMDNGIGQKSMTMTWENDDIIMRMSDIDTGFDYVVYWKKK